MPGDMWSLQSNGSPGTRSPEGPILPILILNPLLGSPGKSNLKLHSLPCTGGQQRSPRVQHPGQHQQTSCAQRSSEMGCLLQRGSPASQGRAGDVAGLEHQKHLRNSKLKPSCFQLTVAWHKSDKKRTELDVAFHVSTTGT